MDESTDNKPQPYNWLVPAGIILVIVTWFLTPDIVSLWNADAEPGFDRGAFGDQFGATSSLFSGLALLMAFLAIMLQSREMRHLVDASKQQGRVSERLLAMQMLLGSRQAKMADIAEHNRNLLECRMRSWQIQYEAMRDGRDGEGAVQEMISEIEAAAAIQREKFRRGLEHLNEIEGAMKRLWAQQGLSAQDFVSSHEPFFASSGDPLGAEPRAANV